MSYSAFNINSFEFLWSFENHSGFEEVRMMEADYCPNYA